MPLIIVALNHRTNSRKAEFLKKLREPYLKKPAIYFDKPRGDIESFKPKLLNQTFGVVFELNQLSEMGY